MKNQGSVLVLGVVCFGLAAAQSPVSVWVLIGVLTGSLLLGYTWNTSDVEGMSLRQEFPLREALTLGLRWVFAFAVIGTARLAWVYLAWAQRPAVAVVALLGVLTGECLGWISRGQPRAGKQSDAGV